MNHIALTNGQTLTTADHELQVEVQPGAQASLVHQVEQPGEYQVTAVVPDSAQLTVITIQQIGVSATIKQQGSVGADAKLHWQNVTLGGDTVEHDLVSTVTGDRGDSSVDWLFYAKGHEQHSLSARNVFTAAEGRGEITMKGVAEHDAHTICNGMIDIGLGGEGTNTYLTEDVLMLDPSAEVDAIPGLEIKTNDVKASHSATVSRVTPEDLFYFGARGIAETEARQMFVVGFLEAVSQNILLPKLADSVHERIQQKYVSAS